MGTRNNLKKRRRRKRKFEAQGGLCWICDGPMRLDVDLATHPDAATFDHVIPRASNGTGLANNLLLAHKRCNANRGGKLRHYEIKKAHRALTAAEIRATNRAPLQHEPETHRRAIIVSKINLTIEADDAADLFNSIRSLAGLSPDSTVANLAGAAIDAGKQATVAVEPEAPKRGRPRKATEAVDPPIAPDPAPTPAEVVAARVAAVSQEATAAAPKAPVAAQEAAPAQEVTRAVVQQALVAVVQKHGRDVCGAICKAHGGPNLSALAESTYPDVYAMTQRVLALDTAAAQAEFGVAS